MDICVSVGREKSLLVATVSELMRCFLFSFT